MTTLSELDNRLSTVQQAVLNLGNQLHEILQSQQRSQKAVVEGLNNAARISDGIIVMLKSIDAGLTARDGLKEFIEIMKDRGTLSDLVLKDLERELDTWPIRVDG